MRMLLMGCADVALGLEPRLSELLRQPEFAGLQRLPLPFMRSNTYLAFNKALYAEQREAPGSRLDGHRADTSLAGVAGAGTHDLPGPPAHPRRCWRQAGALDG